MICKEKIAITKAAKTIICVLKAAHKIRNIIERKKIVEMIQSAVNFISL